jgi:hypothetical protein
MDMEGGFTVVGKQGREDDSCIGGRMQINMEGRF